MRTPKINKPKVYSAEEYLKMQKGEMNQIDRDVYGDCESAEQTINIRALSVNEAYRNVTPEEAMNGRYGRVKTKKYSDYKKALLSHLSGKLSSSEGKRIRIDYVIGCTSRYDVQNAIKALTDILSEYFKFKDSEVYYMNIQKTLVNKGAEFISYKITLI